MIKIVISLVFALYVILIAFAIGMHAANAHDWYETSCCSGKDCAPVPDDTVVETKDGIVVKGYGVLSESDPRVRWSQDERDHLCVSRNSLWGGPVKDKLMCVYRKRKFM